MTLPPQANRNTCFNVALKLIFNTSVSFIFRCSAFQPLRARFPWAARAFSIESRCFRQQWTQHRRLLSSCCAVSPPSTTMSVSKARPVGFHWSFTSVKLTRHPDYMSSLGESVLPTLRVYAVIQDSTIEGRWVAEFPPPDRPRPPAEPELFSWGLESSVEASLRSSCAFIAEKRLYWAGWYDEGLSPTERVCPPPSLASRWYPKQRVKWSSTSNGGRVSSLQTYTRRSGTK